MTAEAPDIFMSAIQWVFCPGVMIEFPQRPGVGVMTALTVSPQTQFMDIICPVATVAVTGGCPENS